MKYCEAAIASVLSLGLVGLLTSSAPESEAPDEVPIKSLERPGGGELVCGLGKDFHAGRRAELRRRLEKGLVVCRGLAETRDYSVFRQDKTFWYLTGVESPNVTLVMDVESGREVLFLPKKNAGKESWDGEMWDAGDEWVRSLTGIEDVRRSGELVDALQVMAEGRETVWISMHPYVGLSGGFDRARPADSRREMDALDGRPSRERALKAKLEELLELEVKDMQTHLSAMRRIKAPEEVEAMRRAGRAGALAMVEGMRSTRPGVGEWEIDALMSYVQVREGAAGPAYLAIVGSGANSLVLHYGANSRTMADGEVLLVDFGPEVDHYTTDITRTWPVNGKFTERQAELYDAVLEAQEAGIAAVKPGATLGEVSRACRSVLVERGVANLWRHGVSHYIGLEVHDVGGHGEPLVPGVAFTIEPGVYEASTGIGIRIEDVVVVTQGGCEVLTSDVPKGREEVERLVGETGVIDWLDR